MQLKTGMIVGLAFVLSGMLSGCATSPFFVSKEGTYAPGFVPRNELGEPVLPTARTAAKRAPAASDAEPKAAPTPASAPVPAPAPKRSSWIDG